jgi:hypothetical protein
LSRGATNSTRVCCVCVPGISDKFSYQRLSNVLRNGSFALLSFSQMHAIVSAALNEETFGVGRDAAGGAEAACRRLCALACTAPTCVNDNITVLVLVPKR